MEKINHQNATQWVERFLDGETSCAQEQEIYAYFRRSDIPAELEQYREMFAWYAGGMNEESSNKKTLTFHVMRYASIAAIVAVIATIGIHFYRTQRSIQNEYALYEGSYIIRDGVKITDLNEILPELKYAERLAEEQSNVYLAEAKSPDEYLLGAALQGVTDPQVRQAITQALSE